MARHREAIEAPLVIFALLVVGGLALARGSDGPGVAAQVDASPSVAAAKPVLDGIERSIVVVGYSTSYAWPRMLQEMLDEHGGARLYHVLNAVVGGSPVGRWIAPPESEDYRQTYGAMRRDFFGANARLRATAPAPTIAVLQQSLQRTPTPQTKLGPVTSVDDQAGIRVGADALERLATQLRDDGIERVVIAMHIYKEGYEPEVGNERFALEALLRRGHDFISRGPDLWSATLRAHPTAFTEDRLHPNELGAKIMAEAWYRTLAGPTARDAVIQAMRNRSYDIDAMMKEYLAWRRGETPSSR